MRKAQEQIRSGTTAHSRAKPTTQFLAKRENLPESARPQSVVLGVAENPSEKTRRY